jgi:glycosyltransferase involved in cell wall biosynthesis
MKILQSFLDPRIGGPQRRTFQIAQKLRAWDIETAFLIPTGSDSFANQVESAGFEVYRLELPRIRGLHSLRENGKFLTTLPFKVRQVRKVIDASEVDIVHANGPHSFTVAAGSWLSNASLVWHLNDCVLPAPISTVVSGLAPRLADELVVTSQSVAEHFNIDPSSVDRLYPPVSIDTYRDEPDENYSVREEFDIDRAGPVIAVVGNLNPIKGHDVLVEAVAQMTQRSEPFTILFVGKRLDSRQNYYDDLQKQIKSAGLEETFRFVGWQSNVAGILRDVDLLAVPSLTESGPMVVLEALAAGCPVVTTDVGIVSESFDKSCAWIVEPGDALSLAAALIDSLNSPEERERRAANGFELVANSFTLERAAERHYDLYNRVALSREQRLYEK